MRDRMIISRAPGSDIKVVATSEAMLEDGANPTYNFALTHIPTGIEVTGQGKQYAATVNKLSEKLLAKVAEYEQQQERRIRLSTADMRPLRAVGDAIHLMRNHILNDGNYDPTVTELATLANDADALAVYLRALIIKARTE